MRNKWHVVMIFFLILSLSGCETLPKKFIRKKPKPEHTPSVVYIEQGPYQKKFSNEYYYKTHFTLWKTWQDEILSNLGGNSKKVTRAMEEGYSHLDQMNRYLKPGKQTELKPLLDETKQTMDKYKSGNDSRSAVLSMKSDFERLKRLISNDFYYDKVKADILPESVDL